MSVMGPFLLLIASVAIYWLWREGVMEAAWLREGEIPAYRGSRRPPSAARTGLVIFLAVALCLFSLMVAAFFMRMDAPDWRLPPPPRILLWNTFALSLGSLALHLAESSAKAGQAARMKGALAAAACLSMVFLFGQFWAWREMMSGGLGASENPANAFFFLLTGTHGLHLAGGLVVLARVTRGAWRRPDDAKLPASVELCAIYWHFLLGVWILLLILLAGWADNVAVICRRLL